MRTLIDLKNLENRVVSAEEIFEIFSEHDASWYHDGNVTRPHALLTSGKCSNGFFDCTRVLSHVPSLEFLAHQLALKIRESIDKQRIDWVIGSPMAGITLGCAVARHLGVENFMFTEKDPERHGEMLWQRLQIPEGETVLQVEELITTAKTLNAVQSAVDAGNETPVNWLPWIAVLVHRPPKLPIVSYGGRKVISLVEKEVWAVDQKDCPLCRRGSKRVRPKTHWKELTGKV